ncbi:dihydrofolate reductase family protein [Nocardioides massiliensis]|uniref:Dihydrofolate reductase n=1 Tax=Nocardioides massiliensis TaxID=1325935 RepID=A0ABT9NPW9_9ACTN|nr:dihydrofolate reductase family protein [Nocardioides massiliensis]MDP9822346.1 dihydrofolate reductase [Nocardioides massiliensis]
MRPLCYSINLTIDGCYDHTVGVPDEELHQHAAATIARADALILGRVTYAMMESAWRYPDPPALTAAWTEPFARAIDAAKKYVVSHTLTDVDGNAELLRGDLREEVQRLKDEPGEGLYVGGAQLPLALAQLGLIDEYEFIIQPRIVGRGPTLFAGLPHHLDLQLLGRTDFRCGAVALRYRPV